MMVTWLDVGRVLSFWDGPFSGDLTFDLPNTTWFRLDLYTLPKTNIAPENGPSQKETSITTIHFQVLC